MNNQQDPPKVGVHARWTPKLGRSFCPVSSYFLANYHRLGPEGSGGLTSTQAMLIIQVLDHQWREQAPHPSIETLAQRLGLSTRAVRQALAHLTNLGLLARARGPRGRNRFIFKGLYGALEKMMSEDQTKTEMTPEEVAA
jgi:predicted transcriptional regulator